MALTVPEAEEEDDEAGVVEADCKGEVSDMDSTVIILYAR